VISSSFGKIVNEHGEMVAEGACEVDGERATVTLRPMLDMPLLERTRGPMRLTLDDGQELLLTDRVIHFRVNIPGQRTGSVYRLYIAKQQSLQRWAPSYDRNEESGSSTQDGTLEDPDELPPDFRKE
jgi:hypothetical protein